MLLVVFRKYLTVLWALLRPQTYLLLTIYVYFGLTYGFAVNGKNIDSNILLVLPDLLLVLVALGSWYISGTSLNDYADYEIDKINLKNDKQRPLVTGSIKKNELLKIAVLSSLFTLFASALTNSLAILLLFSALLLLNIAYSLPPFKISHRGAFAPLLLPLGYIVLTVGSGYLVSEAVFSPITIVVIIGMYVHFMSRIILKDFRDVVGDKETGKITPILKYGRKVVVRASLVCFALSSAILIISLYDYINSGLLVILLLSGAAFTSLQLLENANTWPRQRPLITMYGRFCSGIVTVYILSFIGFSRSMNSVHLTLMLTAVAILIIFSVIDILRLQSK